MTSAEFYTRCIKLYGKKHWIAQLSEAIGKDRSSVYRWWKEERVPRYVETFLSAVEEKKRMARLAKQIARM